MTSAGQRAHSWPERERVERALAAAAASAIQRAHPALAEAIGYALSTAGKRIRPLLFLAAYRAAGGRDPAPGAAIGLAIALEIIHTYSLVHDDLPAMDDDDVRRGRATAHVVYGTRTATLAGAALLPAAMELAGRCCDELALGVRATATVVAELCTAAGAEGMVGGQLLDLQAETREIGAEELERIHRAKTGALLTASLRMGALAAGGSESSVAALTAYGESLGLAFQIADDILDVVGESAALGKTAGRDQALRKASYPALHGVEGARALARGAADAAKRAVGELHSSELEALADYVVERER